VALLPGRHRGARLFTYFLVNRRQPIWIAAAHAVGFLAGLLLLILNAKPWETAPGL
jgi:hypothetical protein